MGKLTIGYGHLLTKSEIAAKTFKNGLSETEAADLLAKDLAAAEKAVNESVTVELNQNQFDALVDFVFNLGAGRFKGSTLLGKVNKGDFAAAASEFGKWNKGLNPKTGKKVELPALSTRRSDCSSAHSANSPIESPSPVVRQIVGTPEPTQTRTVLRVGCFISSFVLG